MPLIMKRFIVKYALSGLNRTPIVCAQNGFIQQSFQHLALGVVQMKEEQKI